MALKHVAGEGIFDSQYIYVRFHFYVSGEEIYISLDTFVYVPLLRVRRGDLYLSRYIFVRSQFYVALKLVEGEEIFDSQYIYVRFLFYVVRGEIFNSRYIYVRFHFYMALKLEWESTHPYSPT